MTDNPDGTMTYTKGLVRDDGYIFPGSTDQRRINSDQAWTSYRASVIVDGSGSPRLNGTTVWGIDY